jgi:hypothetical protein
MNIRPLVLTISLGVLAVTSGCRDQEATCRKAAEPFGDDALVQLCIRERWSDRRIECELKAGPGSMRSLFCAD